ncbi:response regulator transcription factor [Lysinibacillus sp. LZ02]|uniref:response regulator transcription factor n=1 Tax=Lysinibacillus sp. LZ02 TaxID=3420668 RepID=UPI003D363133
MDNSPILINDYHETTEYEKLCMLFQMQQAYVDRTKITFSILLLRWHPTCKFPNMTQVEQYQLLYDYVSKQIRNSDKVFKDTEGESVIIMLAFSGNQEAKHFLNRLFKSAKDYLGDICEDVIPGFLATISEIANCRYTLDEILLTNTQYVDKISNQQINTILSINDFSQFETEHIKVSIIEENPITVSILSNLLHKMNISNFDLQIQTFTDGYQFLQSDWYKSGHTHIVLVNDILPRKNGIEIMNYLRSLPNDEKYIIMLMSKRDSEDAIIYAFDNGADAYFSLPFNLRLVETQIKNILRRLR